MRKGIVKTCHKCGEERLCFIWWDDELDTPVWMCLMHLKQVLKEKENAAKQTTSQESNYRY